MTNRNSSSSEYKTTRNLYSNFIKMSLTNGFRERAIAIQYSGGFDYPCPLYSQLLTIQSDNASSKVSWGTLTLKSNVPDGMDGFVSTFVHFCRTWVV